VSDTAFGQQYVANRLTSHAEQTVTAVSDFIARNSADGSSGPEGVRRNGLHPRGGPDRQPKALRVNGKPYLDDRDQRASRSGNHVDNLSLVGEEQVSRISDRHALHRRARG